MISSIGAPAKPTALTGSSFPYEIRDPLGGLEWVESAEVRMREEGHIFMGEAFVVSKPGTENLVELIGQASEVAKALDWRVHEIIITPVSRLEPAKDGASAQRPSAQD